MKKDTAALLPMPIKAKLYAHQVAAFNFVCKLFGLVSTGGDSDDESHGEMRPVRESIPLTENLVRCKNNGIFSYLLAIS